MRWAPTCRRLLAMALVRATAGRAWAESAVTAVRASATSERTRIVLDLTEPVEFTLFSLADPSRVVLDFPLVDWRAPLGAAAEAGGLIAGLRHGQFRQLGRASCRESVCQYV